MNVENDDLMIAILTVALVTFATRLTPFVLFGKRKKTPPFVTYVGTYLPPAIVAMLVIFSLRHISFFEFSFGIPEMIAVCIVFGLHWWKENTILSILTGTVMYMMMVQFIF